MPPDRHLRQTIFRAAYFNVWRGGDHFQPLHQTAFVIKHARLQIVGVHEAEGNLARLGQLSGLAYDEVGDLLSAYPIESSRTLATADFRLSATRLPNGSRLWVLKGHLPETAYGPYEVRKHGLELDVVAGEYASGRVELMRAVLGELDAIAGEENVLLLAGLNSPSHRDWTPRVVDRHYGVSAQWPVTCLLEAAGVVDAYREFRPNEETHPGYTWTPGYPPPKKTKHEKDDRVDYVFYRGAGLRLGGAALVGEHRSVADIVVRPWPSDHRMVLGEFESHIASGTL